MSQLTRMVEKYSAALDEKERLKEAVKENNAKIMQLRDELAQLMVDEDTTRIDRGDWYFKLSQEVRYAKRSDEVIAASGLDYLEVLREEGMGYIIKETVNDKTLQSAVKAYVEENGELSEGLGAVISAYEYTDVKRRKIPRKPGLKGGAL